jgi:hypothetical protein
MAFQITKEWIINLPEDFEKRVEDEKMIFWKTGVTVVVAAFRLPEKTDKINLLNQIQGRMPEDTLETLVSTKGEVVGLGYTHIHAKADGKKRLSLYTFTCSDTACLQTAFYLDDPDDLSWAKSVWKNIIYHPEPT